MGLSKKVFILSLITSLFMVALVYIAAQQIFEQSYQELEQQLVERNTERARQSLLHEQELLRRSVVDWSIWEEAYQYATRSHPQPQRFERENFQQQVATALGVSYIFFISRSGEVIGGYFGDGPEGASSTQEDQGESSEPPAWVQQDALRLEELLRLSKKHGLTGLDRLAGVPVIISIQEVEGVPAEGELRMASGYVVFARKLDQALMASLSKISRLDFLVSELNPAQHEEDDGIRVENLDKDIALGHFLLNDLSGQPFLRGTVSQVRDVYRQGQESLLLMLLALIAVGLALAAASQWMIFSLVLSRVSTLRDSVRHVAAGGRMDQRLTISGSDELSDLAHDYNQMLEQTSTTQKALQKAMLEAEHASQQKSDFLANMSHEIRTPMTAILGYTELLLENDPAMQERREYLATIHRNSEILLSILNDILDLSKIEVGKLQVNQERVHVGQLLHGVISLLNLKAQDKELELRVVFDGAVPQYINTDGLRLQQVLINLVSNAIKFTAEGYVEVRVSADYTRRESARLRFEVIDTGIGLTEDKLNMVFDPFTQSDPNISSQYGGTGLGLAISKRLGRLLGGDLDAQSTPGQGSCFCLEIQAGDCSDEKLLENARQAMSIRPVRPDEGEQVRLSGQALVVEDNIVNLNLVKKILENAGMRVVTAENGRQACDYLESRKGRSVDIVLMDMHMPVMDGYSAVREIRRQGNGVPIIALTANTLVQDQERCIRAGCDAFAGKPINRDELLDMCRRWLFRPLSSSG